MDDRFAWGKNALRCGLLFALVVPVAAQSGAQVSATTPAYLDCLTPQPDYWLPPLPPTLQGGIPLVRGTIRRSDAWRKEDSLDRGSRSIVLGVHFMNGTRAQKDAVKRYAPLWSRAGRANVTFRFDTPAQRAYIRIRFDKKVNNSDVGVEAKATPRSRETMNLWDAKGYDARSKKVILHEFGHALGLQHEHLHPAAGIPWDRPAVFTHYARYGWTRERVEQNILNVYDRSFLCTRAPRPDYDSVMMYDIRPELTAGRFSRVAAGDISPVDSLCISGIYP